MDEKTSEGGVFNTSYREDSTKATPIGVVQYVGIHLTKFSGPKITPSEEDKGDTPTRHECVQIEKHKLDVKG